MDAETTDSDLLPPPLQPQVISSQPVQNIFDNIIVCQQPVLPQAPLIAEPDVGQDGLDNDILSLDMGIQNETVAQTTEAQQ